LGLMALLFLFQLIELISFFSGLFLFLFILYFIRYLFPPKLLSQLNYYLIRIDIIVYAHETF